MRSRTLRCLSAERHLDPPRLRAGTVSINGASMDLMAPFGGMKMSGHGREWGREGLEEFLEVKSVYGGA